MACDVLDFKQVWLADKEATINSFPENKLGGEEQYERWEKQ